MFLDVQPAAHNTERSQTRSPSAASRPEDQTHRAPQQDIHHDNTWSEIYRGAWRNTHGRSWAPVEAESLQRAQNLDRANCAWWLHAAVWYSPSGCYDCLYRSAEWLQHNVSITARISFPKFVNAKRDCWLCVFSSLYIQLQIWTIEFFFFSILPLFSK